jgi:hypothetical protein
MNYLDASCWVPLAGRMSRMGMDASIGLRSKSSPAKPEPLPMAELMGVEDEEEERFFYIH